jgi:hypothetical protein
VCILRFLTSIFFLAGSLVNESVAASLLALSMSKSTSLKTGSAKYGSLSGSYYQTPVSGSNDKLDKVDQGATVGIMPDAIVFSESDLDSSKEEFSLASKEPEHEADSAGLENLESKSTNTRDQLESQAPVLPSEPITLPMLTSADSQKSENQPVENSPIESILQTLVLNALESDVNIATDLPATLNFTGSASYSPEPPVSDDSSSVSPQNVDSAELNQQQKELPRCDSGKSTAEKMEEPEQQQRRQSTPLLEEELKNFQVKEIEVLVSRQSEVTIGDTIEHDGQDMDQAGKSEAHNGDQTPQLAQLLTLKSTQTIFEAEVASLPRELDAVEMEKRSALLASHTFEDDSSDQSWA